MTLFRFQYSRARGNLGVGRLLFVTMILVFGAPAAAAADRADVSALAWLAGTWECATGLRTITEMWMAPAGGSMLGASRTVADGRMVQHEFMMLRANASGGIEFVARPSGQPETIFALVRCDEHEAVFENKLHDFPQRIIYRRTSHEAMLAAIEGTRAGAIRRIEFPYKRVSGER